MCLEKCFSKTCPYKNECSDYRDINPSCNEDYGGNYCGEAREFKKAKDNKEQDD